MSIPHRSLAFLAVALTLAPTLSGAQTSSAAAACTEAPAYDPAITPPSRAILGFPNRRSLTPEINAYFELVDSQTDRVSGGVFATSWRGTDLHYALVSNASNTARADSHRRRSATLRDPRRTSPAEASRIARTSPAIAWYTGNVHGDEPSGADAALEILYELAARTDCGAEGCWTTWWSGSSPPRTPTGATRSHERTPTAST